MKKLAAFFLLLILALSLTSCASSGRYSAEAYFLDCAYSLVYSKTQSTLFCIKLPLNVLVDYGKAENLSTVPEAIAKFTGLKYNLSIAASPTVLESVKRILDCWVTEYSPDEYLKALSSHAQDLSKQTLLSKINRLCSADLTKLLGLLSEKETETAYMDCSTFLTSEDPYKNKEYFDLWIEQLLGDRK